MRPVKSGMPSQQHAGSATGEKATQADILDFIFAHEAKLGSNVLINDQRTNGLYFL
jgi:hypothetical protein